MSNVLDNLPKIMTKEELDAVLYRDIKLENQVRNSAKATQDKLAEYSKDGYGVFYQYLVNEWGMIESWDCYQIEQVKKEYSKYFPIEYIHIAKYREYKCCLYLARPHNSDSECDPYINFIRKAS